MTDGFSAKADVSGALSGLDRLANDARTHLARSMAVAGGKVFRDEAKAFAPVETGRLRASIYLAYKQDISTRDEVVYTVTWNTKVAPHGHLVEFGHWQKFKSYIGSDGTWWSTNVPLADPRWIAAHPFLRPAYDAALPRARAAMLERGRERLPELLRGDGEP